MIQPSYWPCVWQTPTLLVKNSGFKVVNRYDVVDLPVLWQFQPVRQSVDSFRDLERTGVLSSELLQNSRLGHHVAVVQAEPNSVANGEESWLFLLIVVPLVGCHGG